MSIPTRNAVAIDIPQIPVKKYPANFLRRVFATGILTLSGMGGVLGHMGDTDQSMSMHERA
ncbi:MAG: hypothetical protein O7E57_12835, partial [Gammaproteobacteria bacterium]|nr:hypothetical protein [Gammaproteobacteria bacterium]